MHVATAGRSWDSVINSKATLDPMRAVGLFLVVGLLLAGCVDDATDTLSGATGEAAAPASVAAYRILGDTLEPAPLPPTLAQATLHPVGVATVEPSIAATSDGTLFVIADTDVMRSTDDGATWERVYTYQTMPFSLDPWIWADPITDRVYVDHLTIACTTATWSDDGGDTWAPEWPLACGRPLTDFQKLVTGPPGPEANPQAGVLHPTVAYLCYNKFVADIVTGAVPVGTYGLACAASYDGGLVWQNEAILGRVVYAAVAGVGDCAGGSWIPAVAPDGTVVVRSQPDCLFRTRDSGATWQAIGTGPAEFSGTMMAFDDAGTLYAMSGWWEPPLRVSVSRDQGETWETPYVVQPPGANAVSLPTMVAGAAGKLMVAFWATATELESAYDAGEDTRWDAWLVAIDGADTATPNATAHRANDPDAPMHIGQTARGAGPLFLGDFVTATIGPDGTPYVVFPQTCNEGCAGDPDATAGDLEQLGTVIALRGWPMRAG